MIRVLTYFLIFNSIIIGCNTNMDLKNPKNTVQKVDGFNKEFLIDIKGDTISAYALIAAGDKKKETVILLKGYPGNDNNFDLGQELRTNGFNVIFFDHRGAWGSQGEYLYSNCLEDVEYIIGFLTQPETSENLKIDINKFTLIGRSLGSGVALIAGSKISRVNKIIGISNVNYGDLMKDKSNLNQLKNYSNYMKKQIMMNHNINHFLNELIEFKNEFNIVNYSDKLATKELLLIENTHKNDVWISQLKNPEVRYINSDHNFTSERKIMIEEILNWIK